MSSENDTPKKASKILLVIVPILSFFLGSGVIWNYMNYNIEKERILLQQKKDAFDNLSKLSDLNTKLVDRFSELLKLHSEYLVLLREYEKFDQKEKNTNKATDSYHKIKANQSRQKMLWEEITGLEKAIAKIEGRDPRDLRYRVPALQPLLKIDN